MREYVYRVVIKKEKKKVTGELTRTWSQDAKEIPYYEDHIEKIDFNPFNILGDLRSQNKPYKIWHDRSKYFKNELQTFSDYNYEYGFGIRLDILDKKNYVSFIISLYELIISNSLAWKKEIELEDILESLINQYHIYLECSVTIEKNNGNYEALEYHIGRKNEEIDKRTYLEMNHSFNYRCCRMIDVVFSIFHFLVLHDYRFVLCPLCQKIYARTPTRGKHSGCERKLEVPIDDFLTDKRREKFHQTDQTCKTTLKYIKDYIRDTHKTIQKNLNDKHYIKLTNYEKTGNTYRKFNEIYDKYHKQFNFCPCYNNILIMNKIVSEYRKIWYLDDNKTFLEQFQQLEEEISNLL